MSYPLVDNPGKLPERQRGEEKKKKRQKRGKKKKQGRSLDKNRRVYATMKDGGIRLTEALFRLAWINRFVD